MKALLIFVLSIGSVFLSGNTLNSQDKEDQSTDVSAWIDSQFTMGLDSFNIAGAEIVLMQGDSILHIKAYGLADIESNKAVNTTTSIFGAGSVSKTIVATAIMQLCEKGKLEPDRDVNNYLKSFQLEYTFNEPVTIRQLLTHTAGFDVRTIGTSVRNEKDVIPLAQYLKKQMPPQVRPSGKLICYSNQGYALLGLIVEEVAGQPFDEYVEQHILKPLGMDYSSFKRQAELSENYATSYLQKGGQLIPYKPDFALNYPAGAFKTTASDMGHYVSMLLNHGYFKGTQIIDSATVAKMFYTPFRHYEKAEYGWLPGFSEADWHGIKLYGHGGEIQGFQSQLTLLPEKNLGLFISVNSSSYPNSKSRIFIDNFVYDLLPRLMPDQILKKEEAKHSPPMGSVDEPLEKFAGTYRFTHYAWKTLDKLGILIGLAPEIEILVKDKTLELHPWNDELFPVSDLTFYSKSGSYVAFEKNTKEEVSYFFAQSYSYHKLKWYEPLSFQIFWIGSIVLILLTYVISSTVRKLFVRDKKRHPVKTLNFSLASLIILFIAMLAFTLLTTDPMEFFYGIPLLLKIALVLPLIIIPLELFTLYSVSKSIRFKELKTFDIVYQSVILLAALVFIPWLFYFNLIGYNY